MHMNKDPSIMQDNPTYENVTEDVFSYLKHKSNYCIENGINSKKIIIDPGFGFGKTLDHNYELLKNLDKFTGINSNILVGISRKSMIGNLLNQDLSKRLFGSLSAAVIILYSLYFAPPPVTKESLAEKNQTVQNGDAPSLDQKESVVEITREEALNQSKRIKFEKGSFLAGKRYF